MNILNVGYDSTNYYLLGDGPSRLLVDIGWPGTLPKFLAVLKRKGVALAEVRYLLATHYHPDHAGLTQELKGRGVRLVVFETQRAAIATLKQYMKPENHYQEVSLDDNIILEAAASRGFLAQMGMRGEILATPGHTDDSLSLVLVDGAAFTGDLPLPDLASEAARGLVAQSWENLRVLGVKTIYPGHGPVRQLD